MSAAVAAGLPRNNIDQCNTRSVNSRDDVKPSRRGSYRRISTHYLLYRTNVEQWSALLPYVITARLTVRGRGSFSYRSPRPRGAQLQDINLRTKTRCPLSSWRVCGVTDTDDIIRSFSYVKSVDFTLLYVHILRRSCAIRVFMQQHKLIDW